MQQRFGGTLRLMRLGGLSLMIYDNEVITGQLALVLTAGSHQQFERVVLQHDTVVAARPHRPSSVVKIGSCLAELVFDLVHIDAVEVCEHQE